jgi:integrase
LPFGFVSFGLAFGDLPGDPSGDITAGWGRTQRVRQRVWQSAVRASAGEPCRFHDLRHSHAVMLIAKGTHPKVIQERLGHASIKTTLDVYGHLYEGLDEAAADALDEAFRRAAADSVRILDGLQVAVLRP